MFSTGQILGIRFFNGDIDEVRLFNRTLSAAEILSIYQMTP